MSRIINLRNYKLNPGEVLVKVDRSSILGNPFKMNNYLQEERDRVCDEYDQYFYNQIDTDINFSNEIGDLCTADFEHGNLVLGCWCYPKRCHAETILNYIMHDPTKNQ